MVLRVIPHDHRHRDRDGKHRCGPASAPAPQDAKAGLSVVAKVPRAECAVDLPCAAGRLAIAVYRTFWRLMENSVALPFTDGDHPSGGGSWYFRQPCGGALASPARQRGLLV